MSTSHGDIKIRTQNQGWVLLAEYALGEMIPDNGKEVELTAGFLFHSFLEWGVPPELIRKIESSVIEFAQNAKIPTNQGKLERSGSLRVYCQKQVIDGANAAKTLRLDHAGRSREWLLEGLLEALLEEPLKAAPLQDPPNAILNRGWGYFSIDRSSSDAGASERRPLRIDLYLYQEGE